MIAIMALDWGKKMIMVERRGKRKEIGIRSIRGKKIIKV
jgi:hypothetical protein